MTWYGVVATHKNGSQTEIGEWEHDYDKAAREAINAYKRFHGKAYISLMEDGGTWKDVKVVPGVANPTPVVTEVGFCLHPECGQIHPSSCYCKA